ncbi:MAG: hypothetical protein C4563_00345 [Desulfobulbus sp.]|nr:MAG: hypothetical protein C4563_00345 [Desulfobulbus sp.]
MKMYKKILCAFGAAACVGMLFSVAGMAEAPAGAPATESAPYDEDTYGPEKDIVWNKPVPRVTFSHKVHTMDAGLSCDSCHDDIFPMEAGASESKDDFTMASMLDGNYCGACHDGSTAFHTNSPDYCASCHTAPGTIVFTKPVKAVVFDHKMHVEDYGFNCTSCHSDLFKMIIGDAEKDEQAFTMEALYQKKYCGACHDGEQAFASNTRCNTCHIGVMGFDRMFSDANAPKKEGH